MELKTYQADSMAAAMAAVKRDLGRDAVILHTRSFHKGGLFGIGGRIVWEITASSGVNVPSRRPRPLKPRVAAAKVSTKPAAKAAVKQSVVKPSADKLQAAAAARGYARSAGDSGVTVFRGPDHVPTLDDAIDTRDARTSRSAGVVEPPREARKPDRLSEQVEALTTMVEKLVTATQVRTRHGVHAGQPAPGPQELFDTYLELIQQDVSEEIADELVDRVRSQLTGDELRDRRLVEDKLKEYIASMIPTSITTVRRAGGRPRVIALVGPTGVGKTTTIAKLAANIKLRQGRRVGLITIDTYRIAAVEQLRTYAQIINVPLEVVMSPEELAAAVEAMDACDAVLIDTAGRSPRDAERLAELQAFLAAARPDETHLVLSTTANPRNVESALERFGPLGVDRVILTKLDEAVSFGMILGVIRRLKASLSFVTTGQDVPDDIEISEGARLAELILGGKL